MNRKGMLAFAFVALSASSTTLFAGEPTGRRFGDTQLLTALPTASFPEGVVVTGTTAYVSGPATFGTAGQGPSEIFEIDTTTGDVVSTLQLVGEDLSQEHALSCITTDGAGDLFVLSTQRGVVRINPSTGAQSVYATIPHLTSCNAFPPGPCEPSSTNCAFPPGPCVSGRCFPPGPCVPGAGGVCFPPGPCAPVAVDRGSLPNDLAFDSEGNLFITDSFQATIFRVPAGGGAAVPFYQDPRFDTSTIPGFSIGLNGLRVTPDDGKVVFDVTFGPNAGVYTLPRIFYPPPFTLQLLHAYTNGELPDGLALGGNGRAFAYVTLAGSNQVGILDTRGKEYARISAPPSSTLPVGFDNPANIAFDGRGGILVTNHALFGNPADAAVLDTMVFDFGAPLAHPIIP